MPTRILAVDDSTVNLTLVSQTLTQAGYQVFTAKSGPEALKRVDEVKPELVILDVMMPEMDGYEVCRQLRQKPATARLPVMMLTAQDTLAEKIKGYEAGADEYVIKPFDPVELQMRIKVLLKRLGAEEPKPDTTTVKAKTIAVFSLRGGVGVSTLAANLAVGLTQLWASPAVLVDLVFTAGQVALMLNLTPRITWSDLAQRPLEEIDADLINQVLLRHPSTVRILAAPRRAEQSELLTPDRVSNILTLLSASYHYLVLDLPHDFSDTTLAGLDRADDIIIVLAPELASVMAASSALEVLQSLGYPKTKIRLALNYTFERHALAREAIESALRQPMNILIPFASDVVIPAINNGNPAVLDKPNSEIGALFEDLAFFTSKEEHRNQRPATPSQAWLRAFNRFQQRQKK
ncbi:MAG: response regulator [Chloroflexi bacterium]|nr:response regulator [Chloroflexota bacterium]